MRRVFFLLQIFVCVCIGSCSSYEDAKLTVAEQERQMPLAFLATEGTYKQNFWGTKWILEGTVTNSASVVTYKDVVIQVNFYSKTETLISSENYILYEFCKPGTDQPFKLKVEAPSGTQKLGWELVEAKAAN